MESSLPDGVIMTKGIMTTEEALDILEHPHNYVCISSPPIKPKAGHVYLYRALDITTSEDWRCDQYRWMNGGVSKLPRRNPKLKKFYFTIDTPDGISKRFLRQCYQLVGDKTLTLIHYVGLETVAIDFGHRSAKKETGKVFIRTCSSVRRKVEANQAKEKMTCKQEIPVQDIINDFSNDSPPAIEVVSTQQQHSEPVLSVYELRTYTCHPHKMKDFLNITASEYHLRLKHSKPIGYWTSEIGGLNQVVHLWEYASLAHRDMIRANMAADNEWMTNYIAKVKPMWSHQENSLLTLLPNTTITLPESTGAYELQTLELAGPKCVWLNALQEYSLFCKNLFTMYGMSTLIGTWLTTVGPLNTVVLLWQHPESDSVIPIKEKAENSIAGQLLWQHIRGGHTKLLLPHTNSPLQ